MKKIILMLIIMLSSLGLFVACGNLLETEQYLRIHIRANSNSDEDQNVKYLIKDKVVSYLTPYISESESFEDVVNLIKEKETVLECMIDEILNENGFDYKANVQLNNEYFPTRTYDNVTLEGNFYDAIIINLGAGEGDNWWCVVYPPLCFKDTKNIVYKSKIVEIINQFLK